MSSPLIANLERVRQRIDAVARHPVALLAVTKSVSPAVARELVRAGQRDLAENRAEELEEKADALSDLDVCWHFVGHVQRNKARRIVARADVIHSVDSTRLARTLDRVARELARQVEVFLQVNATREAQKHGIAPEEVPDTFGLLADCPALRPLGLMVMGPTNADPGGTRRAFETAAALARAIEGEESLRALLPDGRCRLSMGMSGDFELAVETGSDLVRVGRALFEGLEADGESPPPRLH